MCWGRKALTRPFSIESLYMGRRGQERMSEVHLSPTEDEFEIFSTRTLGPRIIYIEVN